MAVRMGMAMPKHIYRPNSFLGRAFTYTGRRLPDIAGQLVAYLVQTDAMGKASTLELGDLTAIAKQYIPDLTRRNLVKLESSHGGAVTILAKGDLAKPIEP